MSRKATRSRSSCTAGCDHVFLIGIGDLRLIDRRVLNEVERESDAAVRAKRAPVHGEGEERGGVAARILQRDIDR